mmetsp:Transcript_95446/g.309292  ORF Transcript_95446/g.309292 Transcript_95446/m.309292 type:complete len:85 (-) Transcript_95446:180-434(-)
MAAVGVVVMALTVGRSLGSSLGEVMSRRGGRCWTRRRSQVLLEQHGLYDLFAFFVLHSVVRGKGASKLLDWPLHVGSVLRVVAR